MDKTLELKAKVKEILREFGSMEEDMLKNSMGNQMAGKRARVQSIKVANLLKDYRAISLKCRTKVY